ncbi:hypothetical protein JDV02_009095 [Purpureocillium takamizusanense]|uniref:Uncharacterized protein n=1 Tax=Purpureocillium takamizusanense TaxID=2060973 RepID=A0A9Q8QR58_9HYPO|nr:uncharacterized protein JDV02_009095 [Purpureocillium takamizusanense]UNI23264.1 hypothetical protein JDV02_009095 [Purpureocillium takamizusanense]
MRWWHTSCTANDGPVPDDDDVSKSLKGRIAMPQTHHLTGPIAGSGDLAPDTPVLSTWCASGENGIAASVGKPLTEPGRTSRLRAAMHSGDAANVRSSED